MIGPIVTVHWVDSNIFTGWESEHVFRQSLVEDSLDCYSVGYLVAQDEKEVVIVQSYSSRDLWSEMLRIPMGAVVGIETLKENDDAS